jgi:hypothetical protein
MPGPVAARLPPWANDRVISANQIGDCLTAEQEPRARESERERERERGEGWGRGGGRREGPIYSRGERKDALICISKSNAVRDRPDFYTCRYSPAPPMMRRPLITVECVASCCPRSNVSALLRLAEHGKPMPHAHALPTREGPHNLAAPF